MLNSIVNNAFEQFNQGDYENALETYKSAAKILGEKVFFANIEICKRRIKKTPTTTEQKFLGCGEESTHIINLTQTDSWHRITVSPGEYVHAHAVVQITNGTKKVAIAKIIFADKKGVVIDPAKVNLPRSEVFGSNFTYLADTLGRLKELFKIQVPQSAATLEIGFRLFQPRKNSFVQIKNLEIKKETSNRNIKLKFPSDFKVAFIADEFTYNSFKNEFIAIPIEPESWKKTFDENNPDVFFCESAWSGPDSVRRPWKGRVYASKNFSWENRKELLSIIKYCKQKKIPTIFWNKEDPTHYTDRVNDFVKTAIEFDYVFTSAKECVDRYKTDYGLKNVCALPFATNPRIFNPIEGAKRSNKVVFAGSWYATHPDRCAAMEVVLDRLLAQGFELEIYDRYYGSDYPNRQWPTRFRKYLKPNVPHEEIAKVYKSSNFGLNFNTVTNSETMFARRVFELMSCNTLVISNYSMGLEKMFGDLVVFIDRDINRLKSIDFEQARNIREDALDLVLKEHTYQQRWEQILRDIGIKYATHQPSITVICLVKSHAEAASSITLFQKNTGLFHDPNLLIVVDESVQAIDIASFYEAFNRHGVSVTSVSHAKEYSLDDLYAPVIGKYFIAMDASTEVSKRWIQRAILHAQYTDDFITPAKSGSEKYFFELISGPGVILGKKESVLNFLKNPYEPRKYYVI